MLKIKTARIIDANDLDVFIREIYGKPYCFQQQSGCQPRGMIQVRVPSDEVFDEDYPEMIPIELNGRVRGVRFNTWLETPADAFDDHFNDECYKNMFWERNFYPDFQTILNDLNARGDLEAGEYCINIDY
jgi:hypothetical protein